MRFPSEQKNVVQHPTAKREAHVTNRGREYRRYLTSERWQKLRRLVMLRANGKCEQCLRADGEECAHLMYERIFNERPIDQVWVCKPCHRELDEFVIG